MNRIQHTQKILQRFPTESYKQFSHQTRPLVTIALAICLLALGLFHIVNLAVIYWLLAAFVLDNVALTPIMSVLRAINHLYYGRKLLKSKVLLLTVTLSVLVGALLGYTVLAPTVSKFLFDYIALTGCSPFLISMGALLGGYISHATHKIPLFWGIFVGSCIASVVYIPVPIIVEVVYFSAVALAFVTTIVAKQSLRFYFRKYYDHTNADGYDMACPLGDYQKFVKSQAQKFNVSPQELEELLDHCRQCIADTKQEASWWDEYMNTRQHTTNSYKDIYHGLMNPSLTDQHIQEVKYMITHSNLPQELNTRENRKLVSHTWRVGTFFNPNLDTRMMAHQFNISDSGGLDPKFLKGFQA